MKIILNAMKTLCNLRQNHGEDLEDYLNQYKAATKVFLTHVGKDFSFDELCRNDPEYSPRLQAVMDEVVAKDKPALKKAEKGMIEIRTKIQEEFFAYMYMSHADQSKYGSLLMQGLDTKYSLLKNKDEHEYPTELVQGHFALGNHKWGPTYKRNKNRGDKDSKSTKEKKDKKDDSNKPASIVESLICAVCRKGHMLLLWPERYIPRLPQEGLDTQVGVVHYQDQSWPTIQSSSPLDQKCHRRPQWWSHSSH